MRELDTVIVQMQSGACPEENLAQAKTLLSAAQIRGAALAVLPENVLCHGTFSEIQAAARPLGEWLEFLHPATKCFKGSIVWGGIPVREKNRLFNVSLVTSPAGKILARYEKNKLFHYRKKDSATICEADIYTPGKRPASFSCQGWDIGLSICFDLRFPQLFARYKKAHAIVVTAAFTRETGKAHWLALLRARAIENQCYIFASNQHTRPRNGIPATFGHSAIIAPWGEMLHQHPSGAGAFRMKLNESEISRVRSLICMD
ncbi:MAG: hypothetical protein A2X49_11105 [Lentisphaerae bacterium GWF2_52_8]|nr:MAG: hypothetical protein A2X49_11105 [Lentisphaerae bacterium GWF2_52_8]